MRIVFIEGDHLKTLQEEVEQIQSTFKVASRLIGIVVEGVIGCWPMQTEIRESLEIYPRTRLWNDSYDARFDFEILLDNPKREFCKVSARRNGSTWSLIVYRDLPKPATVRREQIPEEVLPQELLVLLLDLDMNHSQTIDVHVTEKTREKLLRRAQPVGT